MSNVSNKNDPPKQLAPSWLDREYVQSALRETNRDSSLTITKFQVVPAAGQGEHYMSALYRVHLEYSTNDGSGTQEISLIAKTKHIGDENPDISAAADSFDVLSHEILMYKVILPKLIAQLESAGRHSKLVPKSVKTDPDQKCLLLEDLCGSNFRMANKRVGLDMKHAKLALTRIAEFHAAGARLNETESGHLQTFDRNAFTTDAFESFFVSQMDACGQAVQKWAWYKLYGEKLVALAPKVMDRGRQLFRAEATHFNTFIHSDFWINNMMFKYDTDGAPSDCALIDFQVNCWTSPAIDLIYFVNTSLEENLRWEHEEELIRYYHSHLVNTLEALAFQGKVPDFKEFWSQYEDKGFNGSKFFSAFGEHVTCLFLIAAVTSVCIVLPFILKEPKDETTTHSKDATAEDAPYLQPRVQRTLKKLLPIFDQKGFLK